MGRKEIVVFRGEEGSIEGDAGKEGDEVVEGIFEGDAEVPVNLRVFHLEVLLTKLQTIASPTLIWPTSP